MKKVSLIAFIFTSFLYCDTIKLDLEKALNIALEKNHQKKISQLSYDVAIAQYKQALSANYPSLDLDITASKKDEAANYTLNGSVDVSQLTVPLSGLIGSLTPSGSLPSNALPSTFQLDGVNVKTLGRDTVIGKLELTYPLYTGGKISSIINQAKLNKKIKQTDINIQDDELIFLVKKVYYSHILSKKLYKTMKNSYEKMKMVKKLTERLYKGESLNVSKTDYLKTKVTVSLMKGKLDEFQSNISLTKNALKNLLVISYSDDIQILDDDFNLKIEKRNYEFNKLFANMKVKNPLLQKIDFAQKVINEKIKEKESSYLPTVALFAQTSKMYNDFDGGVNTDENENSWVLGVNARVNLFNGFKNQNEIIEQNIEKRKLIEQKALVNNALALNLNNAIVDNTRSFNNTKEYKSANFDAIEHRDLNIRAYKIDMVKTKDVIEAQIMQTRSEAMYHKAAYEYVLSIIKIDKLLSRNE